MKNILIIIITSSIIIGIFGTIINYNKNTKFSKIIKDKERIIDSLKKNNTTDTLWLQLPEDSIKFQISEQLKKIQSQRNKNRALKEYIIFLENENQFLGSILAEKELEDGIE
jgi:peptidoglycan hydrolase CwlO-like protein